MEFLKSVLNPISVLFIVSFLGCIIGKIKILGFNLDVAAVLLLAVLFGVIMSEFSPQILNDEFKNITSNFSKIGTSLFVSSIGLSAGATVKRGKNAVKSFIIGSLMSLCGFLTAKLIGIIDGNIEQSLLMGILCGALTTTPGLSTLCESEYISSKLSTLGYGIAYIFGVVAVVLFAQSCQTNAQAKLCRQNIDVEKIKMDGFVCVCGVSFFGALISNVQIPIFNITLGATAGLLLSGIICGALLKLIKKNAIEFSGISFYRNIGLTMFFVGNGINAGESINTKIEMIWLVYGVIITVIVILVGIIMCKLLIHRNMNYATIIAGGMTSTPAASVILKKENTLFNASEYTLAYLGALVTIVLCMRFLVD